MFKYLFIIVVLPVNVLLAKEFTGKRLYGLCIQCHGKHGKGLASRKAPRIAGQFKWYIEKRLLEFRDNNTKSIMNLYAKELTNKQISKISSYIESLK